MATDTVDHTLADDSEDRRLLALEASWEIEAITTAMVEEIASRGNPSHALPVAFLHFRGMLLRANQLSGLIMSALDDPIEPLTDLEHKLKGSRSAQEGVQHG